MYCYTVPFGVQGNPKDPPNLKDSSSATKWYPCFVLLQIC